jgi:hypothetical protein
MEAWSNGSFAYNLPPGKWQGEQWAFKMGWIFDSKAMESLNSVDMLYAADSFLT